jgi:hypothetical protein
LASTPEVCDRHAAQQKGSVENLVKWVKTNFLPGRSFADDEDLAQQSLTWEREKATQGSQALGQRPIDLLPQERAAFGPLATTAASDGLYRVATVNRESLVRVDGNQSSIPVGHLGHAVDVRVFRDVIRISRDGVLLAEHARLDGAGQRHRDPDHYLAALTDRPRAPLVLERERLCGLGAEVAAYVTAISQRRRRVLGDGTRRLPGGRSPARGGGAAGNCRVRDAGDLWRRIPQALRRHRADPPPG